MKFNLNILGVFIGIMLITYLPVNGQINEDYMKNWEKAYAAKSDAECQSSLQFCIEALKVVPDHPVLCYLAARLNAQLGHNDIAIDYLDKATKYGYHTKMLFHEKHQLNDSAFITLREREEFKEIIDILKVNEKPVHKSEIAFTINDRELNPEGITYDSVEKVFYLGSIDKHKIVKVDLLGKSTDFTKEGQDGLYTVLGIHVDPIRRTLWAVSRSKERSEVFKYNLSNGELIKKYFFSETPLEKKLWFNDLVIHPNGDLYVGGANAIYMIPSSSDELELFLPNSSFVGLNGITLSDDGNTIYVSDYFIGIYYIDIKTKSHFMLTHELGIKPHGVDGLYFLNNSLYAVQDVINTSDKFSLNREGDHIENCEIFERNTQYLHYPTTGVIVDDYFYFIADTQAKAYKKEGIIVMKTPLK